ncbi:hypothetical protein JW898_04250 [Candidatus Woesearchaeota archaeon]|nr:hypothetical protein [Candidatus Woesearchaeota archaeon]
MVEKHGLLDMISGIWDQPTVINKLQAVASFFRNGSGKRLEDRIYERTKLRKIRSGIIVRKSFNGVEHYLLGRKIWHDEDASKAVLKTAGGYMRVAREFSPELDRSSIDCMLREAHAEGFTGEFCVKPETIAPFAVVPAKNGKGVLQFFYADLDRYPTMGKKGKAKFRPRKDHDIYVRWCSLDSFLNSVGTPEQEYDVQPETVGVLVEGHPMERSVQLPLKKSDLPSLSVNILKDGSIEIPEKVRGKMLARCGLKWLDSPAFAGYADSFMRSCRVYYAVPRADLLSPRIPVFFQTDLFLYEEKITGSDVDLDCEILAIEAPRIVRSFVNARYSYIVPEKMLDLYVV